ncbi:hypothetical protein GIB67_021089 [Kingdonia uniflora]|uniref:Uncharacterized protein n=1 Tax=Kingdonia uniflora TaxID=39325 RepID=A0A7J7N7D6_9MAGN|nr:hypothetical protein GIB67_021089 [Kingdonia uniflora]
MRYKMERIPFLEEQVRKLKEAGKDLSIGIQKTPLFSEENRFYFVNDVAGEATKYVENNRDEYRFKKTIMDVLSNRMNDAEFYRSDGYMEPEPFKPGPTYLRKEKI